MIIYYDPYSQRDVIFPAKVSEQKNVEEASPGAPNKMFVRIQKSCFSDTLSFYRAHPRVPD